MSVAAGACVEANPRLQYALTLSQQKNTRVEQTRWTRSCAARLNRPALKPAKHWLCSRPASRPANLLSNASRCRQNSQRAVRAGLMGQQTNHSREPNPWWQGTDSLFVAVVYLLLILRLFNSGVSTAQINMLGNIRRMEYLWRLCLTMVIEEHY
jgi:hypothetical protein